MRRRPWIFPVTFIVVVLVLTIGTLFVIWAITENNLGPINLKVPDLNSRLDELRSTIQFLIVAAGLFALAQGAASFFSAVSFTKQADDAIKRINDKARDAETSFPIFARVEDARRDAYASLADIFRDPYFLDWRTTTYERLGLLDRQKLLSVERFISIELVPYPGEPEEYVRDLRRLANFYASKHRYEAEAPRAQAQWADLERSEYYLKLAIRAAGDDSFHLFTDLGVVYMEYHPLKSRLPDAESQFLESVRRMNNQQRAHYNLGLVARYRQEWKIAIGHYEEALRHDNWERWPLDKMRCAILYNQACAFARYSYDDEAKREHLIARCLQVLTEASRLGSMSLSVIEDDFKQPEGAFAQLNSQTKAHIENLKGDLTQDKARPPKTSWEQIVRTALDKLIGKA